MTSGFARAFGAFIRTEVAKWAGVVRRRERSPIEPVPRAAACQSACTPAFLMMAA